MNEIRDILIGIDFGKTESQLCYYDRKAKEPVSLSMKVGTSQYEFPTCMCKSMEQNVWYFGLEAVDCAKEQEGILVEGLYEICKSTESVQVGIEEMQPWELMGIFLDKVLKSMGTVEPVKHTKCLVITVERLTGTMVENLQKACEDIGFSQDGYMLQDYSESFYYYTLCQKPEYWSRSVGWYAFAQDLVKFRKLSMTSNTKPVLVTLEKPVSAQLPAEAESRDAQFCKFVQETLGGGMFSSILITGNGFHQEWAGNSIKLLCKHQRKVFYGNNLFAKGACYTAKEKLEDRELRRYLYLSDALVKYNIGMDMMIMGSPAYYPIIQAGKNWYECRTVFDLILDDTNQLTFYISQMQSNDKQKVSMPLPGLPSRPNRTTRLRVCLECQSETVCKITVRDMGFGEMYSSSKRIWTETIQA